MFVLRLFAIFPLIFIALEARKVVMKDNNLRFILLHNNDLHARFEQTSQNSAKCLSNDALQNKCFGGFPRVATVVKEFRSKAKAGEIQSVLYLNAGDTYTGTPWFSIFTDSIAADFMNLLKPDAMCLGNHEFDEGTENLAQFLKKVNFPILAANLNVSNDSNLQNSSLKSSIVIKVDGTNVGIIGYLTPQSKATSQTGNVDFTDEIVAINNEASRLKDHGVNVIIALGHSGIKRDKEIAVQCPEVDLVVGGHSHTFLFTGQQPDVEMPEGDYPTVVTQANGKKVPIVQAHAFTKYLGYLELVFDVEGNLINFEGSPILLDASIQQDPEALQLLDKYRPGIINLEHEIVGSTLVFLNGSCRKGECNLGNFLTDAFVDWRASNFIASNCSWTDAPIALMNSGGIRASINHKANPITKEDVTLVLPFSNRLSIVEVTGKTLISALEHAVHRYQESDIPAEFLQMSGIQVVYDMKQPSGRRVKEVKTRSASQASCYQKIDESQTYRVLVTTFLANGGDGFKMFKGQTVESFDKLELDVVLEYFIKKSPVSPQVENRIIIER